MLVYAACALVLLAGVILLAVRRRNALSFLELTEEEQDRYIELANKIDALLTRNYLRKLPARLAIACFTMGLGLMFSNIAYTVRRVANARAKRAARVYVQELRRQHGRVGVAWRTFPSAHNVVGSWMLFL
jgi:hypothetical protein